MDPSHKASILDKSVIETLKELGGDDEPELFVELVDLFLEDARANFEALGHALDEMDVVTFERTAHTLKSSCGNIGAAGLSRTCFKLEQLGRSGYLEGAESILAAALSEFEEVCVALMAEKD
jgi:HPt (histidine-containing phosphotransfer) domain-containing protein